MEAVKFVPKALFEDQDEEGKKVKKKDKAKVENKKVKVFEGFIMIALLGQRQRYRLINEIGVNVAQNTDGGDIEVNAGDRMNMLVKLIDKVDEQVKSVHIKHIATGREYKTFEDLEHDSACEIMVNELGALMMKGVRLGEI